jgi:hypothetical protein
MSIRSEGVSIANNLNDERAANSNYKNRTAGAALSITSACTWKKAK